MKYRRQTKCTLDCRPNGSMSNGNVTPTDTPKILLLYHYTLAITDFGSHCLRYTIHPTAFFPPNSVVLGQHIHLQWTRFTRIIRTLCYLGGDAEVFEESLMRRPELSPHCFPRSLVEVQELRGFLETVSSGDPEFDALVVDVGFVHGVHRNFADAERDASEGELTGDVPTAQLHVHRHQLHRAHAATLDSLEIVTARWIRQSYKVLQTEY